jgi:hypothetical protein
MAGLDLKFTLTPRNNGCVGRLKDSTSNGGDA